MSREVWKWVAMGAIALNLVCFLGFITWRDWQWKQAIDARIGRIEARIQIEFERLGQIEAAIVGVHPELRAPAPQPPPATEEGEPK